MSFADGETPKCSECHSNVDRWVRENPGATAVRGWVTYLDFQVSTRLTAHSVVRGVDGQLFDITPLGDERDRAGMRFVPHLGSDEEFLSMKESRIFIDCMSAHESEQLEPRGSRDVNGPLLQLHIAEYTALTTRNNNWVTIQIGIWSVMTLYITAAIGAWAYFSQLKLDYGIYIVWGSGIVLQLIVLVLYLTLGEIYINVYYIEEKLRPLLSDLVDGKPFWGYEAFLAKDSKRELMDWASTSVVLAALLVTALIRHAFTIEREFVGLLVNVPLSALLVRRTWKTAKLRRRFQKTAATG